MMDVISIPSSFVEIAGRLTLAAALGAVAGANREWRQKPAGLRTHALVALGAALAAVIGVTLLRLPGGSESGAVSRTLQGIFAGIGFIGGGVILHRQDPQGVHGLTTAASIWVVAATGVAAGVGMWRTAVLTIGLALIVLVGGQALERGLHKMHDDDRGRRS